VVVVSAIGRAAPAALVLAVLAGLAGLAGCDPDIVSGSYLCGPQMLCPGDQVCSPGTGRCERPENATPFACVVSSEDGEPNETAATATALALATCPTPEIERLGCLPAPSDADWISVTMPATCAGRAISIDVRYNAAFAPPHVDQMSGDVVAATAAPCNITGGLGATDAVCLDTTVPPDGVVLVRVTMNTELTCDGACDFTSYSITAAVR
jgi:hypothetical protein